MIAEDAVLVGVINRKGDFEIARDQHWYRVPVKQAPRGIFADYLAFFLSGKVFKEQSGTIPYYAKIEGHELAYRRDLLPEESPHPRDDEQYYKVQFHFLLEREPPIINQPSPYRFAFIYTTGDRFEHAHHIRDLYSSSDYFVDRVFHALKQGGVNPIRRWAAARSSDPQTPEITYPTGARIRVLCENGEVTAGIEPLPNDRQEDFVYLRPQDYLSEADARTSAHRIMERVRELGGAKMIDIPVELY